MTPETTRTLSEHRAALKAMADEYVEQWERENGRPFAIETRSS